MQDETISDYPPMPKSETTNDDPNQSLDQAWQSVADFMKELKSESNSK